MKGSDGLATDQSNDPYAELYAAHQVHALAQLLIQRLQSAGADLQAEPSSAAGAHRTEPPVSSLPAEPLKYWYP